MKKKIVKMDVKNNRWMKYVACAIYFLVCILYSAIRNETVFYYDSGYYWSIADSIGNSGGFNILDFPETFRGYFFPTILYLVRALYDNVWAWRVLSAMMISIAFAFLLPTMFDRIILSIKDLIKSSIAYALFMYFWRGFMQFPLSDFVAIFFLLLAIVLLRCLEDVSRNQNLGSAISHPRFVIHKIFLGGGVWSIAICCL